MNADREHTLKKPAETAMHAPFPMNQEQEQ